MSSGWLRTVRNGSSPWARGRHVISITRTSTATRWRVVHDGRSDGLPIRPTKSWLADARVSPQRRRDQPKRFFGGDEDFIDVFQAERLQINQQAVLVRHGQRDFLDATA